MLDCTELRQGDQLCCWALPNRVLYKGKTLIYQYSDPGPLPHYIFHTPRGSVKKLSQMIVKRDVWKEIQVND